MTNQRTERRRLATAYHEAGHAVANIVLGSAGGADEFSSVSIGPNEDLGRLEHEAAKSRLAGSGHDSGLLTSEEERAIRTGCIILFAGMVAEKKSRGRSSPAGARADRERAVDLALHLTANVKAYLRWIAQEAEGLFEDPVNWAAVESIAKRLMAQDRLSYDEAHDAYMTAANVEAGLDPSWRPSRHSIW